MLFAIKVWRPILTVVRGSDIVLLDYLKARQAGIILRLPKAKIFRICGDRKAAGFVWRGRSGNTFFETLTRKDSSYVLFM